MSDDVRDDQPPGGGSYIRQKDGSLVRRVEDDEPKGAAEAPASHAKSKPAKGK